MKDSAKASFSVDKFLSSTMLEKGERTCQEVAASSLNACSTEQHNMPDKDDFLIACLGPLFDAFVPIALPHHTASRNRPQKERRQVLARRHDGRGIRTSKITNHRSAMPHAALRTSHEVQCQCTSWLCHHKQQLLRELRIRSPQHTEEAFQASTRHCMEAEHLARLKWSGRCALRIVDRQSGHGMCANLLENAMDGLAEDKKSNASNTFVHLLLANLEGLERNRLLINALDALSRAQSSRASCIRPAQHEPSALQWCLSS